jgi:sulfofructosephosphate aldolase
MTTAYATPDLSVLTRPSGAFAMLAVDQREALRAMFAEHQSEPVTDEQVTDFKLAAARTLTPHASAVLLDKQFVLDRAIEERAVDPGCALIAAADEFIPSPEELVADVRIDAAVDPGHYRDRGVRALKLLVIYRPDTDPGRRIDMVEEFVERCRANGLISIIEPVSRAPLGAADWDWDAGVLAAARELGRLGADLYKAEVPLRGQGSDDEVRAGCAAITETVTSPWVVLSSGVHRDEFPRAVALACAEGASGFLAGRAVWSACIPAPNPVRALEQDAVRRLELLCQTVDEAVARH